MTAPNPASTGGYRVGQAEFIALIAFLSALNALAIDVMLPAFGAVREAFGLAPDATQVSLIVTAYLAGMGIGQYVYGPITDAYGRKPVLYVGVLLYLLGATGAILSPSLEAMIVFRFLWGLGAAGPRVVSIAIVRDRYSGDDMARVLAVVMAVFMIVPAIAPSIGQVALSLGSWRYPFVFAAAIALLLGLWAIRLRETLPPRDRMPLSIRSTVAATREVFRHRRTAGLMLALTFAMGAFFPYLGSGQLIYERIYDRADQYAYWFGLAAVFMAVGSVTNSRLVKRVGAEAMLTRSLTMYVTTAAVFVAVSFATAGAPPFAVFYVITTLLIAGHVVNGALLNSLAMEDVGHIAGTAAAVIGTVTTVGGSLLGSLVDRAIADSVVPFSLGFFVFGLAMVGAVASARRTGSGAPRASTPRQPA